MLDGKTGRVLLMDFGIAKAMDSSIEQFTHRDRRGDRHTAVHESRAGDGQERARSAQRPVLARHRRAIRCSPAGCPSWARTSGRSSRASFSRSRLRCRDMVANSSRRRCRPPSIRRCGRSRAQRFASMDAFAKSLKGEHADRGRGRRHAQRIQLRHSHREASLAGGCWAGSWCWAGWAFIAYQSGPVRVGAGGSDPAPGRIPPRVTRPESVPRVSGRRRGLPRAAATSRYRAQRGAGAAPARHLRRRGPGERLGRRVRQVHRRGSHQPARIAPSRHALRRRSRRRAQRASRRDALHLRRRQPRPGRRARDGASLRDRPRGHPGPEQGGAEVPARRQPGYPRDLSRSWPAGTTRGTDYAEDPKEAAVWYPEGGRCRRRALR